MISTVEKPAARLGIKPFTSRFACLNEIGNGSMGKVFQAKDNVSGNEVALKVSDNNFSNHYLHGEAVALSVLPANSHLPMLIDCGYDWASRSCWLATNFISGDLLSERLNAEEIALPEALALIKQAAEGLFAAAQNGVYHRDVNPCNLMIDWRKQVQIIDFGAALVDGGRQSDVVPGATAAGPFIKFTEIDEKAHLFGTPGFMSPEALNGDQIDCRSDIFSLGVVFYAMVARSLPFSPGRGVPLKQRAPLLLTAIRRGLPPLSSVSPDDEVQSMTEAFARKFTAFDRGRRFQTYHEVIDAAQAIEQRIATISRWPYQLPIFSSDLAYAS